MKESYRQKPLLTLAAGVAAMALLLAGCGGGTTTPQMPEPPPDPGPPPPTGPTAESLKADAADAITAAVAAGMAAGQAEKDAIKYAGMIDTASVSGESAMATANAQMVLNAEMAANDAVMDADDALQAAMAAKTAAEALAADDAGRAGAIAAAEEAIKQATAQKEAAQAILDKSPVGDDGSTATPAIDSLKDAVAAIKGDDMEMPNDPAHHGQQVAMAIDTALGPQSNGLRTSGTHTPSNPTIPDETSATVQMDDHQGMTWKMIVGADNVMMKRLGLNNAEVQVASIAGMTATDSITSFNADSLPTAIGSPGTYMGIPGTVYCLGDDCEVDDNGNLAGSWYFSPTSEDVYYEMVGTATTYSAEANYARYGYWLTVDASGVATLNTYATGGVDGVTSATGVDVATVNRLPDATTLTDEQATYRGTAVGISLHKAIDGQGNPVDGSLSSGAFQANVMLTAKFGTTTTRTTPTLGGMIDGFTSVNGGNNVDPAWSVKLSDADFTSIAVSSGVADASGQDGVWTAQGYGTSGERPIGIYGGFDAHFTDGHAAGAFATRKE